MRVNQQSPCDPYLVDVLRDETGVPDFDLTWFPVRPCSDHSIGCWALTKPYMFAHIEDDGAGGQVLFSSAEDWIVMLLDGNHDNPMEPGRWLVDAINACDEKRHGRIRRREVDEIRKERVEYRRRLRRSLTESLRDDDALFKMFAALREDLGSDATTTRDEIKAMEVDAAKTAERNRDEEAAEVRDAALYTPETLSA